MNLFMNSSPRTMPSRYDGKCKCGNRFSAGTQIIFHDRKVIGCPACTPELAAAAVVAREVFLVCDVVECKFHNDGFTILMVRARDTVDAVFPDGVRAGDAFSVKGNFPRFGRGDVLEVRGRWNQDPRFGWGLRGEHVEPLMDGNDAAAVETVLRQIDQLGPKRVGAIIRHFGADKVFEVLDTAPDRLLEVEGIGHSLCGEVKKAWKSLQEVRRMMGFLASLGLDAGQRKNTIDHFDGGTVDIVGIVTANPYALMAVPRIGFKTCDDIAIRRFRLEMDDPRRLGAALTHLIQEEETGFGGGHTTTPV